MGVNLLVTYKGKIIADLGRKHNYSCGSGDFIPNSYEEIEEELGTVRKQVIADVMTRVGILGTLDRESYEEVVIGLVSDITDSLEWLEEECITAGRVMTLLEFSDEFNEGIEVIDELELEVKEKQDRKWAEDKENYFKNLRNCFLEDREKDEEAAWKRLDEYLDACEEDGMYDAAEHQTSEVDLDFEKDTLVGEAWEDELCDHIKDHRASVEEIGYCSECRRIQIENDEYLDRQNRN